MNNWMRGRSKFALPSMDRGRPRLHGSRRLRRHRSAYAKPMLRSGRCGRGRLRSNNIGARLHDGPSKFPVFPCREGISNCADRGERFELRQACDVGKNERSGRVRVAYATACGRFGARFVSPIRRAVAEQRSGENRQDNRQKNRRKNPVSQCQTVESGGIVWGEFEKRDAAARCSAFEKSRWWGRQYRIAYQA